MPRESGASSNHRPVYDPLSFHKPLSVVTGSPAFAGDDNPYVARALNGHRLARSADLHPRSFAHARDPTLSLVDSRPAGRAVRAGAVAGAVPAALLLVPPVDGLSRLVVGG